MDGCVHKGSLTAANNDREGNDSPIPVEIRQLDSDGSFLVQVTGDKAADSAGRTLRRPASPLSPLLQKRITEATVPEKITKLRSV